MNLNSSIPFNFFKVACKSNPSVFFSNTAELLPKCFRNGRGSLTVEASLVLPFFLCIMVVMMFFLKTICVAITVEHAVNDTVKQLSGYGYIMSFFNDLEDEKAADMGMDYDDILRDEMENFKKNAAGMGMDVFQKILAGDFDRVTIEQLLRSFTEELDNRVESSLCRVLIKQYGDKYLALKHRIKQEGVLVLLKNNLDSSVEMNKLSVLYCELPQSIVEYRSKTNNPEYKALYRDLGFTPGIDDVVLLVKYDDSIQLPFFGRVRFTTLHRAVEKGWMAGSRGLSRNYYGADDVAEDGGIEDIDAEDVQSGSLVYVTKTGTKYHSPECLYLEKSRIPLKLELAIARGYLPCKVCITKTAKPIKRKK